MNATDLPKVQKLMEEKEALEQNIFIFKMSKEDQQKHEILHRHRIDAITDELRLLGVE